MRQRHILAVLTTLLLPCVVWADVWQDPVSKVNYEYTPGQSEASVKGGYRYYSENSIHWIAGSYPTGDITILSDFVVDGWKYTVTAIDSLAFVYNGEITSVVIPNTVKSIGDFAFCIPPLASITSKLKKVTIPNSVTSIGHLAFRGCIIESIEIPSSVISIGEESFEACKNLYSVTIPNSVKGIGMGAFLGCKSLSKILSNIVQPFTIDDVFRNIPADATLYIPAGTKALYEVTEGWNKFKNIVEMVNLEPMAGETTVNTENLDGQDLTDNVVDDVYYNVGDGGYDAEDGSVVISQATNMSSITDAEPGTDDMKENFTGMILKVAKGKGTVKVKAKTSGNVQLVVQVGKGVPMLATMNEQGDAMIGYDVKEDSYVYIYAIMGSSLSRTTRASSDSELRIYDIAVSQFDTTPRLPGDTNNDGKLDIVDVTTILDTILGRE